MKVFEITDYSYTAEYNDGESLGIFTYAKLLNSYEMQHGESLTPDYADYVISLGKRTGDKLSEYEINSLIKY